MRWALRHRKRVAGRVQFSGHVSRSKAYLTKARARYRLGVRRHYPSATATFPLKEWMVASCPKNTSLQVSSHTPIRISSSICLVCLVKIKKCLNVLSARKTSLALHRLQLRAAVIMPASLRQEGIEEFPQRLLEESPAESTQSHRDSW